MNNAYAGSSFDDFLEEEGIATEVKNEAIKRLISYNLLEEMQKQNINKTEMAKKNVYFSCRIRQALESI